MSDATLGARGLPVDRLVWLTERYRTHVVVDFDDDQGNATIGLSDLARALPGMSPQCIDLIEAAGTVVLGDVAHLRGRNEAWSRDLAFHLPSRGRDAWQEVGPVLEALLSFVTGDAVRLEFDEGEPTRLWAPARVHRSGAIADADCVCLLSGGIDSLAGGALLIEEGRRPLFVTRDSGNPSTRRAQDLCRAALDTRFGPQAYLTVALTVSKRPRPRHPFPSRDRQEPSRRARSLFPLATAAAACAALDIAPVFIPENGVLAAQLPLTRARLATFTTRTTHPKWLHGLAGVFSDVLGHPVEIRNHLSGMTKAEVLAHLLRILGESAARATVSCWSIGREPLPCGGCVPCVLRALAFAAADLSPEATMDDPLSDPERYRGTDAFRNLVSVFATARDFALSDESRLMLRYPELAYLGDDATQTVATLRRFAREAWSVCEARFPSSAKLMGLE